MNSERVDIVIRRGIEDSLMPQRRHSVEAFLSDISNSLDSAVRRLTEKKYWILWIGAVAVAINLFAHTPHRSLFQDLSTHWTAKVINLQIAHPLTPIDFEQFKAAAAASDEPGTLSHLDKLTFRISIPTIGKVLHTGAASFLVLNYIAGLLFFPLLAHVAYTLLQDRVSAAYVTFAFALSWAGAHFFSDGFNGDGFAWACLLAAIYFRHPLLIFGAVLTAAFTDERAIFASAAAFLFWLSAATADGQEDSRRHGQTALTAIGAAWVVYFILRLYLSYEFGLKTGMAGMFPSGYPWYHAANSIPYRLVDVFQGLWLWVAVGIIALYISGRVIIFLGFVVTLICILAIALEVNDFRRSLAYAFLLIPVAWQAQSLEATTVRKIARSCFVLGICLIVPYNTVLRYLNHSLIWFG